MRASDLDWLQKDQHFLRNLHQIAAAGHNWIPVQDLPFDELILFAYAADRIPRPTYHQDCIMHVPDRSYHKPALPKKSHHCQAFTSLTSAANIGHPIQPAKHQGGASIRWWGMEPTRSPEEEARDILATAAKNQPEDGPALAGLPSVHVNTLEKWLANMTPNYSSILQRYFQMSPKLLGFGEACPGVLKVTCCGVASRALRNLATSVSMIWICFKVM